MLRDTSARCDRRVGGSRRRLNLELLTRIRGCTRIAVAVSLLACFASLGLWASTSPEPALTVHRSTRAVPHRFTVHPDGATVAANQSQRFEVTDAQGRPVAVRWNVSGIGCFGAACGTIDKQGVYRTPSSLPQPRVVILEAVVVSDPNYSVLTQVRLEDAATAPASSASAQVVATKTQPLTAPVVGRQNVAHSPELALPSAVDAAPGVGRQSLARSPELPLPSAIDAAPVVGRQSVARNAELPPLPSAVAAAPVVKQQSVARNSELPPLPSAVAAAPVVRQQSVARNAELPPLPSAVAAAPVVKKQNSTRKIELPLVLGAVDASTVVGQQKVARSTEPQPRVVAAAPVVGTQNIAHNTELPPLPGAVAAAPVVGTQNVAHNTELPPLPGAVAAAPVVGTQNVARSTELPPLPRVVAAAPVVGTQNVARSTELPPQPRVVAAAPVVGTQNVARSTELLSPPSAVGAAPAVGRHDIARSAVLSQLPDEGAAARVATVVGTPRSPMVTYKDGQLTIETETLTLAEVLKLVAEKTGAEIDVPPGTGLDRVIEHTGPGRAEDVLASLLNGSPFDFVIVSSPQPPHDPTQVLLFLHRTDTPATDQTASASAQPAPPSNPALWKPPATSSFYSRPADAASASVVVPPTPVMTPPAQPLSPEVREQMMRDFSRQLRGQPPQAPQ